MISDVDGHELVRGEGGDGSGPAETGQPTLICCKTIIGKGAPNKQGTDAATVRPWCR